MQTRTLNQRLAENLATLMDEKKLSANQLGKKAGVSPRTLANYLKTDHNPTDKGKERSAKLTEVEKIASALDLAALALWVFQAYYYLRWGGWFDGSLVSALAWTAHWTGHEGPQLWAARPDSWQGLHTIMGWVPAALVAFMGGGAILTMDDVG